MINTYAIIIALSIVLILQMIFIVYLINRNTILTMKLTKAEINKIEQKQLLNNFFTWLNEEDKKLKYTDKGILFYINKYIEEQEKSK